MGSDFKYQPAVETNRMITLDMITSAAMPNANILCDALLDDLKRIATGSSNWGSPNLVGFPDAGNSVSELLAAMLTPLFNQNLAKQDICSALPIFKEMETVHWLRQDTGSKVESAYQSSAEIGNLLTPGGCLSDTVATMAARERVILGSRMIGVLV
jgi:hypothetical protein